MTTMILMELNIPNKQELQSDMMARLFWFRDMSDFYRRARDFGEYNEYEVKAFEIEKHKFLTSNNLESLY